MAILKEITWGQLVSNSELKEITNGSLALKKIPFSEQ